MFIGRLQKDHSWNYGFSIGRDLARPRFSLRVRIWLIKFIEFPEIGATLDSGKHNGFFLDKVFFPNLYVIVYTKTFYTDFLGPLRIIYWIQVSRY